MPSLGTDTVDDAVQVGEPEMLAHYAEKEEVTRAYIEGIPIVALCGKIWIPSRDPERYPICPRCKEVLEEILKMLPS